MYCLRTECYTMSLPIMTKIWGEGKELKNENIEETISSVSTTAAAPNHILLQEGDIGLGN